MRAWYLAGHNIRAEVAPSWERRLTADIAGTREGWKAPLTVVVVTLFAAPLGVMALGALADPRLPPTGLLPARPSLQPFAVAFSAVPLARALWNSALVCAAAVPLSVLTASWAGLAIARSHRWTRRLLTVGTLVLLTVPVTAIWMTRFALMRELGWVGTYLPLIAPALMGGGPLFVLLYADAFGRLPAELFDAARVEGAGVLRQWWTVAMPLVGPTHAAVALLALAAFWSNFVDPLLYLSREDQLTAPMMLRTLELLGSTQWSVLLAACVVVTAPAVVAFALAQRALFTGHRGAGWLGR